MAEPTGENDADVMKVAQTISQDCIAVRIRLINRVISSIYDNALRPLGIRVSQLNLLVATARLREPKLAELSRKLRIEKSTLSRDIAIMKERGWLVSVPPEGGKNQILRLTAEGASLLIRSSKAWETAQAEAARVIEPDTGAIDSIANRLGLVNSNKD